jgi:hypothetical protein
MSRLLVAVLEHLLGDVAEEFLEGAAIVRQLVITVIFGIAVGAGIAGAAGLLGLGTVARVLFAFGAVYLALDFVVNRPDLDD